MYKIAFDPFQFVKSLGKVGLKALSMKWDEIPEELIEAFGIEHTQDEPSRKAAQLISLAMAATLPRALRVTVNRLRAQVKDDAELVKKFNTASDRLVANLSSANKPELVAIEPTAFSDPAKLPRLEPCITRVRDWLVQCGCEPGDARAVVNRIPAIFAEELLKELRANVEDYELLMEFVDTKLTTAWQHQDAWKKYTEQFDAERERPGFLVKFPTHHLFIWPRAYFTELPEADDAEGQGERKERMTQAIRREVRHVVDFQTELTRWWETFPEDAKTNRSAPFRVVGGDPGGGKSTTTREFAHLRASEHNDLVLYCPIHKLRNFQWKQFETELRKFFKNETGIDVDPVDSASAFHPLLLILDGLDELSAQGEGGQRAADQFVTEVMDAVRGWNTREPRVAVLFSGRPIPTQEVAHHFREPGQVLHLLPYVVVNFKDYHDPNGLLSRGDEMHREPIDHRPQWWAKYGEATGQSQVMPEMFKGHDVIEITAQPMMHHLAAVVSADKNVATTLCPDGRFSRPALFRQILAKVHKSEWRDDPTRHPNSPKDLTLDQYTKLLSVLGQAAWHGGAGRVTTVSEFHELCKEAKIEGLLAKYSKDISEGPLSFFTSFYVRYSTSDGTGRIEFTHKAFAEYLTAVRLADMAERLTKRLAQPKEADEPDGPKWAATELLLEWLQATGPAALTSELFQLLCEEVKHRHSKDGTASKMRDTFIALLNANLHSGMPADKLEGLQFQEMTEQAANAEHALICLLGASVLATRTTADRPVPPAAPSGLTSEESRREWLKTWELWAPQQPLLVRVAWPSLTSAADLIRRVRRQAETFGMRKAPLPLWDLDLHAQWLQGCDLSGAGLSGARLDGANLDGANLVGAGLDRASLSGARLDRASLFGASLDGARLDGASLSGASLDGASLSGARLDGARLDGANLVGAGLDGARLDGARLDRANLFGARLDGARLDRANLIGANLSQANLVGARLDRANLDGANLDGASLSGVRLDRASLSRANLFGADLSGATYDGFRLDSGEGHELLRKLGAKLK